MPYLPEEIYADMRKLSMFRDQLTEDRIIANLLNNAVPLLR